MDTQELIDNAIEAYKQEKTRYTTAGGTDLIQCARINERIEALEELKNQLSLGGK